MDSLQPTPPATPGLSSSASDSSFLSVPASAPGSAQALFSNFQQTFKKSPQMILGGLLVLFLGISGVAGFWLSQTSQDVRQQAAVDDEYGTVCTGSTPVKCSCGVCGATQAECNSKCPAPTSNAPTPTSTSNVCTPSNLNGTCPNGFTCGPLGTCISTGSGACSQSNPTGSCNTAGQTCVAGVCITPQATPSPINIGSTHPCAPSNPSGYCPGGFTCGPLGTCIREQGTPIVTCTQSNPTGVCQSGKKCVAGVCIDENPGTGGVPNNTCSASNRNGTCPTGQICLAGACITPTATPTPPAPATTQLSCPSGSTRVGSSGTCSCDLPSGAGTYTFAAGGVLSSQCTFTASTACPAGSIAGGATGTCRCTLASGGSYTFQGGVSLPATCTTTPATCPAGFPVQCSEGCCAIKISYQSD